MGHSGCVFAQRTYALLGRGCRILVVDDNKDSANSLAMLLRRKENDVRVAYDGVEAVKAAEDFRPELVLLDIGLPKLNGYESPGGFASSLGAST